MIFFVGFPQTAFHKNEHDEEPGVGALSLIVKCGNDTPAPIFPEIHRYVDFSFDIYRIPLLPPRGMVGETEQGLKNHDPFSNPPHHHHHHHAAENPYIFLFIFFIRKLNVLLGVGAIRFAANRRSCY